MSQRVWPMYVMEVDIVNPHRRQRAFDTRRKMRTTQVVVPVPDAAFLFDVHMRRLKSRLERQAPRVVAAPALFGVDLGV
jgi:hypothetical protein